MLKYVSYRDSEKGEWIETSLTGKSLLATPLLNKGTAFTEEERIELKLLGKLPYRVETLDEQYNRAKNQYDRYTTDLSRYIYLNNLHDKNEILYYKLISENLTQILPIIYTPGVSNAVKAFSTEFRQPRGLYLSYPDKDRMDQILENRTHENIDLIVVTDGERVLGIGDQGIGAMDIPIAKLVVYSLCGVNPYKTLPIMLDVGTNNPDLLNNPAYLGWRNPRIQGAEYDDFIRSFVQLVHKKFPKSFLHWEDFGQQNARRILETHHTDHCMFNDDMQGTGVVTLAALLSAVELSQIPLADHRVVIFGAGIAGVGIADQLYSAMQRQGISAARKQFWLIDRNGLIAEDSANLMPFQMPYAREKGTGGQDLLSVVKAVKPTILIGCSTVGGAFNETVVKEMAQNTAYPIIFPLSNPTEKAEANPSDLLNWTQNQALIATGSPFEGVSQCNNALAFPGIGLGVMAVSASALTDNMLWAAANAIAKFADGKLLPPVTQMRELAFSVAVAVAKTAIQEGLVQAPAGYLEDHIQQTIWQPYYRPIKLFKVKS